MVAAQPQTVATFLHEVAAGSRGFATLRVWNALVAYVQMDSGELRCSQRQLARTAGVTQGDVYRALIRLCEIGAIMQTGRGKYKVHPSLMWKGELQLREKVAAKSPVLTLVEGGKSK
jgi:DNA-binding IclR family transcriptional regulator